VSFCLRDRFLAPKWKNKLIHVDVGTLLDGSKFDSSRDRGSPFVTQIGVGRVIKGWDEGVTQLSVGQKANLICTPDYGQFDHLYTARLPRVGVQHS
jgi:FKBP-type peptidyl-prolyl cis-trans isomerase